MIPWLLATITIGISVFDAVFTQRRLQKYGLHIELNASLIQWSMWLGGLTRAVIASTVVPTIIICSLLTAFDQPLFLAVYLGMRLQLFKMQLDSLEIERVLDLAHGVVHPSSGAGGPSKGPHVR